MASWKLAKIQGKEFIAENKPSSDIPSFLSNGLKTPDLQFFWRLGKTVEDNPLDCTQGPHIKLN